MADGGVVSGGGTSFGTGAGVGAGVGVGMGVGVGVGVGIVGVGVGGWAQPNSTSRITPNTIKLLYFTCAPQILANLLSLPNYTAGTLLSS